MGRNKNEKVATFHKAEILKAAEKMFQDRGFSATTIADISTASKYSRRTIYTYFDSKEDILHHMVKEGLEVLKANIEKSMEENEQFIDRYWTICHSLRGYHLHNPQSFEFVDQARTGNISISDLSQAALDILRLGEEVNLLLADLIKSGIQEGAVLEDVQPEKAVYILWASLSGLFSLVQSKGPFIARQFLTKEEDFLEDGFKQLINSILKERI